MLQYVRAAAWNGSMWVATGNGGNSIVYSYDSYFWYPVPNWYNMIQGSQGQAVAWNGTVWVLGSNNTSSNTSLIWYSYDGINWSQSGVGNSNVGLYNITSNVRGLYWTGNTFVAACQGANCILTSVNGINWTGGNSLNNYMGGSTVYSVINALGLSGTLNVQRTLTSGSATINNNMFILGNAEATSASTGSLVVKSGGIAVGKSAYIAGNLTVAGSIFNPNSNNFTGSVYMTNTILSFNTNSQVMVSVGNPQRDAYGNWGNTIAYSTNGGLNWTGVVNSYSIFSNQGYAVAYNGKIWVAVGGGTNSIAYSYNGISWVPANSSTYWLSSGYGVYWNGNYWMAFGNGNYTMAYSYDGINWNGIPLNNCAIVGLVYSAAWNGYIWVAGGNGGNTMAYSYDGFAWTGMGAITFNSTCYTVQWNGILWVAGGNSGNTLAYSYNGINWYGVGFGNILNPVFNIAWNGSLWVATGSSANNNSTIANSYDGINWNPIYGLYNNAPWITWNNVFSPTWNGNAWIAGSYGSGINNYGNSIIYSSDGFNWTGLGNNAFPQWVYGVGSSITNSGMIMAPKNLSTFGSISVTNPSAFNSSAVSNSSTSGALIVRGGVGIGGSVNIGTNLNVSSAISAGIVNSNYLSTTNYVTPNSSFVMAVGYGYQGNWPILYTTNNFANNGISWTNVTQAQQIFSFAGYGIIFTGQAWVAVGSGINSIAYSYNGTSGWVGLGTSIFTIAGNAIASSGSLVVAVGSGTNSMAYSTTGGVGGWVGLGNNMFIQGYGIAFNGSIWVASGSNYSSVPGYLYSVTNTSGLQLYYPFDNNFYNYATGSGVNDTTVTNATITTTNKLVGNGGLSLINTNCYLRTGTINFKTNTGFAIAFWINTTNNNTIPSIYNQNDSVLFSWSDSINSNTVNTSYITANYGGGGCIGFYLWWNGSGYQFQWNSNAYVSDSTWRHVIINAVWISTNYMYMYVYINGQYFGLAGAWYPTTITGNFNSYIGTSVWSVGSKIMNAYVDDFRFFNRSLSGQEITGLYNVGLQISLAYSYSGTSWFPVTYSKNVFTVASYNVAWNGSMWVSVGQGGNTIAYSYDGINWSGVTNSQSSVFSIAGYGVAWNGTMWLAGGWGGSTLAYSYNGTNWYGIGNPPNIGYVTNVTWTGTTWLAFGGISNNSSFSVDGFNWTSYGQGYTPTLYGGATANNGTGMIIGTGLSTMNNLTVQSGLYITGNTNSSSSSTGSLVVRSGVGIGGALNVGGQLTSSTHYVNRNNSGIVVALGNNGGGIIYSTDNGNTWNLPLNYNQYQMLRIGGGVAYNGTNRWVAVGYSNYAIGYSNDGKTWYPIPNYNAPLSANGKCVVWNGTLWVAGGGNGQNYNTLAYSYDGISWVGLGWTIFSQQCSSIAWNGTIFVAVGYPNNAYGNTIAYSKDGINWTGVFSQALISNAYAVAWNGRVWVTVGSGGNIILYSYNGINWNSCLSTSNNNFFNGGTSVAWNGTMWVVGGSGSYNTLLYSYDGIAWNAGYAPTVSLGQTNNLINNVNGLTWTGTNWLGVGSGVYSFVTSTDGINWYGYNSPVQSTISSFTGVFAASQNTGSIIANNGMNNSFGSVAITNTLFVNGQGTNATNSNSGALVVQGGAGINGTLYVAGNISVSGTVTSPGQNSFNGDVSFNNAMILVNQSSPNVMVAGGYNPFNNTNGNTLAYSLNGGQTWQSVANNYSIFSGNCQGIAWNGTMWIAVGGGTNSMAYSYNGINWYPLGNPGFGQFYCIAWNGMMWVAGASQSSWMTLVTSYNGFNWTYVPFSANPAIINTVYAISWNGTMWVMAGNGNGVGGNSLAYSYNGYNWYGVQNSYNIFISQGTAVAWNGTMWVAGGSGNGNSLAYSYNGINWFSSYNSNYTANVNSIYTLAWNGTVWVAGGNPTNLNSILSSVAYSYDGVNWTPAPLSGAIMYYTHGITWTGTMFIGVGTQGNTTTYSYDGITWRGLAQNTTNTVWYSWAYAVASATMNTGGVQASYGLSTFGTVTVNSGALVSANTVANNYGTGALVVRGGASVTGNFFVAGNTYISSTMNALTTSSYVKNTIVSPNFSNQFVIAGGYGLINMTGFQQSISYSYNAGVNWSQINYNSYLNQYNIYNSTPGMFNCSAYAIALLGSVWLATGFSSGPNSSNMASSVDGINWAPIGSPVFTWAGYGFGYNGTLMLAAGTGGNTLAYSYDGKGWVGLGSSPLSGCATAVSWNGSIWVAVGGPTQNNPYNPRYDLISQSYLYWYYPMNQTTFSGLNVADYSNGYYFNYNATMSAAFNANNYLDTTNQVVGTACVFLNGNYITLGNFNTTNNSASGYVFAFSGWFRSAGTSGGALISINSNAFAVYINANGQLEGVFNGTVITFSSAGNINNNTWYHVAVSVNYSQVSWWINGGTWSGTGTCTQYTINANTCQIGRNTQSGATFNGRLAEIRMYIRTLSQSEAYILYNCSLLATPAYSHTIAYSYNGTSWYGLGNYVFTTQGTSLCWNGLMWVATGSGGNTIAYSYNGINWNGAGTSVFSSAGSGTTVAWNGNYWLVGGVNTGNSMGYSYDGINWYGLGANLFPIRTNCITWSGSFWLVAGYSNNNGTMFWSYNPIHPTVNNGGINWTSYGYPFNQGIYTVAWAYTYGGLLSVANSATLNNASVINNLFVGGNTVSRSAGTGTMVVKGGVGIGGSLNVSGFVTSTGVNVQPNTNNIVVAIGGQNGSATQSCVQYSINGGQTWINNPVTNNFWNSGYAIGYNSFSGIWLVGGNSGTMAYSYNLITWSTVPYAPFGYTQSLYSNNLLWVGAGWNSSNTLAYSIDGINWYGLGMQIFTSQAYSVAWNGSVWIAGGTCGSVGGNSLAYSFNGINWTGIQNSGAILFPVYSLAWNGYMWVAGGGNNTNGNSMAYSYNGFNWFPVPNSTTLMTSQCFAVAWNGSIWVAGGNGTWPAIYSYNGINWSTTLMYPIMTNVNAITWTGSVFIATGNGSYGNNMASSPDGINWRGYAPYLFQNWGYGIVWAGSPVYGVGTSAGLLSAPTVPALLGSVVVNTSMFVSGNLQSTSSNTGALVVQNGMGVGGALNIGGSTSIVGSLTVNGSINLGGSLNITGTSLATNYTNLFNADVSMNNAKLILNRPIGNGLMVALGNGSYTIAYSSNGITWTPVANSYSIFSSVGYAAGYNGKLWVAVGSGTNTLAYSADGITWNALGASIFTSNGYGIIWNGGLWVAVGGGTNSLAYSYNGTTWYGLGLGVFQGYGWAINWNGSMLVSVGNGGNTIAYSYNGTNWYGLGINTFTSVGYAIAWNGLIWVAGGTGGNTLAYSYNGITWNGLGSTVFTTNCFSAAWNGSMWVAVGSGTNTLAYSYDGINWTGLGTTIFSGVGYGLTWNNAMSLWVAGGNGTNTFAYSQNGINWSGLGNTTLTTAVCGLTWNGTYTGMIVAPQGISMLGSLSVNNTLVVNGNTYSISPGTGAVVVQGGMGVTGTINVGGLNVVQPTATPMVIVSGYGGMGYSYNGTTFTAVTAYTNGIGQGGRKNRIAFNGYMWICTQEANNEGGTNAFFYSYDGVKWTGITGLSIFGFAYCIVWNGFFWLAGGTPSSGSNYLAYSYNGIVWTTFTPAGVNTTPTFLGWNGSMFILLVAGGTNTILYSYNGFSWTGLGSSIVSPQAACWNGAMWVLTCNSTSGTPYNNMYYSYNGINWFPSAPIGTNFQGNDIKWGNNVFVAGGSQSGAAAVAVSSNGIYWTVYNTGAAIMVNVLGLCYNGTYWLVCGVQGSNAGMIAYTQNFVTWTNVASSGTAIFTGGNANNITYSGEFNNYVSLPSVVTTKTLTTSAISVTGVVVLSGTGDAYSPNSGALVVSGGVGIAGNVFVGGNIWIGGNITHYGNTLHYGNVTIFNTTNTNTSGAGALVVSGGIGMGGNAFVGGNLIVLNTVNSYGNVVVTNIQSSISASTGALVVSGGIGMGGNAFVGGNLIVLNTVNSYGNVVITNVQSSTSTNTGALVVKGGVGIAGVLNAAGVSTTNYIETMNALTYAASISVNFNNGGLYYVSGTATPITSVTITNLPTTPLTSYTFSFILTTASNANYITATTVSVNGTSVTLRGTISLSVPAAYIIQQVTIFNTSATGTPSFAAITSALAY